MLPRQVVHTTARRARRLLSILALRRLRGRVFATAAHAFAVADARRPDTPIIDANPAFTRLTGYARDEVLGRNCRFLQGPGTDRTTVRRIWRAVAEGQPVTETLLNYRKDGSSFWNELTITPVRDGRGRLTHFVGVQGDVSARLRNAELASALAGEREANRLKSEFLALMSHELRTPLGAILGYADLLLAGSPPLSADQAADARQIVGGADRLLGLVDDVLDLAQVEAERLVLSRRRVALAPAVADALDGVRPRAAAKGLALAADVPAGLVVDADPPRLHQVLLHLLANAVKFTARGGVRVEARADAAMVRVAVADTGVGIAPESLPLVFDHFWQADPGSTRAHGGSGLGLAIAKRLAELHGGTIGVESTPGEGSTFTLLLPISPPMPPLVRW